MWWRASICLAAVAWFPLILVIPALSEHMDVPLDVFGIITATSHASFGMGCAMSGNVGTCLLFVVTQYLSDYFVLYSSLASTLRARHHWYALFWTTATLTSGGVLFVAVSVVVCRLQERDPRSVPSPSSPPQGIPVLEVETRTDDPALAVERV